MSLELFTSNHLSMITALIALEGLEAWELVGLIAFLSLENGHDSIFLPCRIPERINTLKIVGHTPSLIKRARYEPNVGKRLIEVEGIRAFLFKFPHPAPTQR